MILSVATNREVMCGCRMKKRALGQVRSFTSTRRKQWQCAMTKREWYAYRWLHRQTSANNITGASVPSHWPAIAKPGYSWRMRRHDISNIHVCRQSYARANVNLNYQQLKKGTNRVSCITWTCDTAFSRSTPTQARSSLPWIPIRVFLSTPNRWSRSTAGNDSGVFHLTCLQSQVCLPPPPRVCSG